MSDLDGSRQRSLAWGYAVVLAVTATLTGVAWWSQARNQAVDCGDWVSLSGTWFWTDAAAVDGADPALDATGWKRVDLPGGQGLNDLRPGRIRWYRRRFALAGDAPTAGRVLSLGRIHADHWVWLNGVPLGGAGSLAGEGPLAFDTPRFYLVPAGVLTPGGDNVVALKVRNRLPDRIGLLAGPLALSQVADLGPLAVAGDRGQLLFGAMLLALGLSFLLLARRGGPGAAFVGLAVGTVSLGLNSLSRGCWGCLPGVDGVGMELFNTATVLVPVPFLFHFACQTLLPDHVPPVLRLLGRWLFLYPVLGIGAVLIGGVTANAVVDRFVNDPLCLVLALAIAVIAVRAAVRGDAGARVLTFAILVLCAGIAVEILIGVLRLDLPRFLHLAGLLQVVLTMAMLLAGKMAALQRETERAKGELEVRVAARTRDLALTNEELDRRNREQRELLHVLCHDLANPVGAIRGALELLEDGAADQTELLALMRLAGDNAAATIESVRHLRSLNDRPPDLAPVDLVAAVGDSLQLLGRRLQAKGLAVDLAIPAGLTVRAEQIALINSVLANVLTNAIKFTPAGGRISIAAGAADRRVVLTVRDTGIGMPEHIRAALFDLGAPTSRPGTEGERGTGYGLPMVHRFMVIFGGEVTVDSREDGPGAGTTVTLVFRSGDPDLDAGSGEGPDPTSPAA